MSKPRFAAISDHYYAHLKHWHDRELLVTRIHVSRQYIRFISLQGSKTYTFFYRDRNFKEKVQDYIKEKAAVITPQPLDANTTETCESLLHSIATLPLVATKEQSTMSQGFIKLNRSDKLDALLRNDPNAFALLTYIAINARRTYCPITKLQPGETLLNDPAACGLTYQQYRYALQRLKTYDFTTSRTTNRGTILKLKDTTIYDINVEPLPQPIPQADHNLATSNSLFPVTRTSYINNNKERKNERTTTTNAVVVLAPSNEATVVEQRLKGLGVVLPSSLTQKLTLEDVELAERGAVGAVDRGAFIAAALRGGW